MDIKELISQAKEVTASGLPFMEGKEKIELKDGSKFIVKNYGYLNSNDGDFVVIADDNSFAFGGSVVTDSFKKLDDSMSGDSIAQLLEHGIEIKIAKKKSKTKREYTTCEFFPD